MTAVKNPADYITPEDYLAHYANDLEEKWELIEDKCMQWVVQAVIMC